MGQKLYITTNPDMEPIKSYWITGSLVDKIFKILRISIKPEIAVNEINGGFEVHFDTDNTTQWQFELQCKRIGFVGSDGAIVFDIKPISKTTYPKSKVLEKLMGVTYFTIPKKFVNTPNLQNITDISIMDTFLTYLYDIIKHRDFSFTL